VWEIWFRSVDRRYPFLWDGESQPAARWHRDGEGPAQYISDTPDGAWAEFLRHEEISDPADLEGISRVVWAIELELDGERLMGPRLQQAVLLGGYESYPECQEEARRLRARGASGIEAPSAALMAGSARGQRCEGDALVEADDRDGRTLVLYGPRPEARAWIAADRGAPGIRLLSLVRHL